MKPTKCPYFRSDAFEVFGDDLLSEVRDIEDVMKIAQENQVCPYYGTRSAQFFADVVFLPYQILLHQSTREACGVKLKGNILIIDEAHNLIDTINSIHTVQINGEKIAISFQQLTAYQKKFASRLKAKNLFYVRQLLALLEAFLKILGGRTNVDLSQIANNEISSKIYKFADFVFAAGIDSINMFKLLRYMNVSQIARKLSGFVVEFQPELNAANEKAAVSVTEFSESKEKISRLIASRKNVKEKSANLAQNSAATSVSNDSSDKKRSYLSPLIAIESFMHSLTDSVPSGRFIIDRQAKFFDSTIKYLLLNPAAHFQDVVKDARSVILAGGTMEPISEIENLLLKPCGISESKITIFSCGHIVGPNQLHSTVICRGPNSIPFEFTFQTRKDEKLLRELGCFLVELSRVVPGGIVVFFPSYDYVTDICEFLQKSGQLDLIGRQKKVFREQRTNQQADRLISEYSAWIGRTSKSKSNGLMSGAILFAVVGGKLSEGINFSDDLGRCVVMVGMPYPNSKSLELQEKMSFLDSTIGNGEGRRYYENLCMKAVNQSIGRAPVEIQK